MKKHKAHLSVTILFAVCFVPFIGTVFCGFAHPQTVDPTVDSARLAQASTFVFNGTVQQTNATTVPQLAASPLTVEVRVDSIQRCSTNLCGSTGRIVTVKLAAGNTIKSGDRATFFTRGWLLGSGIAVVELKHISPPEGDDEIKTLLTEGSKLLGDELLKVQLKSAKCVITGKVENVKPLKTSFSPNEHVPRNWQDATVDVLTIEKPGCLPAGIKTVHVVFPVSKDVEWVTAPKFQEGQTGIWILNPVPGGRFKTFNAPSPWTYTSLHNHDFKGLDDIDSVRAVLEQEGARR